MARFLAGALASMLMMFGAFLIWKGQEKRFDRADRDNDGRIKLEELLQPRRKPFAKLDKNGDGRLSFEEWAVTTIDKFKGADKDGSGVLTRAEYATTAPKPRKKKSCGC